MGMIEDVLNNPVIREGAAQDELESQGSVMAKTPYKPGRLGIAGDVIAELLKLVNPVEWMGGGGGGGLAHVPGTFRKLGLKRQEGLLDPIMFVEALQKESNYPRYKQLVENIVRKALGGEFKAYRGMRWKDPLMDLPVAEGVLPKATAASLDPEIAEDFSRLTAGMERTPSHIARFKATPESVLGLTPRRGSFFGREAEVMLDPRKLKDISLQAKVPAGTGVNVFNREAPLQAPDSLTQQLINDVLEFYKRGGR